MLKRSFLLITFCLVLTSFASSLDLGLGSNDAGVQGEYLDFATSARSLAMGRAYTASSIGAESVYCNASRLANIEGVELTGVYSTLFEDTSYSFFAAAIPTNKNFNLGVAFINLSSADAEKRSAQNQILGTFSNSENSLIFSLGKNTDIDGLSYGASVKVCNQSIDNNKDTGFGFDGSVSYKINDRLDTGFIFRNILAPKLTLKTEEVSFPRNMRLGLSYVCIEDTMLFAVDFDKTDSRDLKLNTGLEYIPHSNIALRCGFNESEITFGLGFNFSEYTLDYAYAYHDATTNFEDLGSSHRLGFVISF